MIQHTKSNRCPVCGGANTDPKQKGIRCWGFTSDDRKYVRCTRESVAGSLEPDGSFYVHFFGGPCDCGITHQAAESNPSERILLSTYEYRDEQDKPLYRVLRYLPKSFSQERWDEKKAKWIGGSGAMNSVRRVPYRLPELLQSEGPILIVEGEKDVDTAYWLGFTATCNVGGSGQWKIGYNAFLKDRDVIIIPDGDEKGKKHQEDVQRHLTGYAKSIKVVELPEKDLTKWVEEGGTKEELQALIVGADTFGKLTNSITLKGSDLVSLIDSKIEYVIEPVCPAGTLTLIQGMPKSGKSTFSLWLALCAALGIPPADVFKISRPRKVLFVEFEDNPILVAKRSSRYLSGAGWDGYDIPDEFNLCDSPNLWLESPSHEAALTQEIRLKGYELIVIDTLSYVHQQDDENASAQMKLVMASLKRIVKSTGCSIIIIHHSGKGKQGGSAITEKARGSSAIPAAADVILDWGDRAGTDVTPVQVVSKYDDSMELTVEYKRTVDGIQWVIEKAGDIKSEPMQQTLGCLKELLMASPEGVSGLNVSRALQQQGISQATVYRHLGRMSKDGKLIATPKGRETLYRLSQ